MNNNPIIIKSLGTVGLQLAVKMYGSESIRSYGDSNRNGSAAIPMEDSDVFDMLVAEEIDKLNSGVSKKLAEVLAEVKR